VTKCRLRLTISLLVVTDRVHQPYTVALLDMDISLLWFCVFEFIGELFQMVTCCHGKQLAGQT